MSHPITELPVETIRVGRRFRTDDGDLSPLMQSIAAVGLLQPVGVNGRGELVFGGRRLAACKRLGMGTVPVRVLADLDDVVAAVRAERDENTCRKEMTTSELVALGKELEALERPAAAARETLGKFSPGCAGKTRDKVGEALGVSGKTFEKAKAVVDAGVPELVQHVDAGVVSVDAAAAVAKLPPSEQQELVRRGPKAVKAKAKELKGRRKLPRSRPGPSGLSASQPLHDAASWALVKMQISILSDQEALLKRATRRPVAERDGEDVREVAKHLFSVAEALISFADSHAGKGVSK